MQYLCDWVEERSISVSYIYIVHLERAKTEYYRSLLRIRGNERRASNARSWETR